jgi:hypothetical protein
VRGCNSQAKVRKSLGIALHAPPEELALPDVVSLFVHRVVVDEHNGYHVHA